jgi:Fe-S-cluster containining protein
VRIRCLSVHAPYACAHAGACCRAGWTIPVEEVLIEPLRVVGITIGRERVAPTRPDGACVFFEADGDRLCTIHRRAGPSLLPSVCRHFPRVIVNDPRGASVTLSHFCPTAADLLFEPVSLAVVDAPSAIALDGGLRLEGLDATGVLPPLLAPGILTDWDGYSAWEEAAVALFNVEDLDPERALAMLTQATDESSTWKPGRESLTSAVRRAFTSTRSMRRDEDGRWHGFGRVVNAFLAAHAFASWAAYEPGGLRSVAAAVGNALELLTCEVTRRGDLTRESLLDSIRAADLQLRHSVKTGDQKIKRRKNKRSGDQECFGFTKRIS